MKTVLIKTVDTDVIVLRIAMFNICSQYEFWIEFGTRKYMRYIPIHNMARNIVHDISKALLGCHAFTGCDQVLVFLGHGKISACNIFH